MRAMLLAAIAFCCAQAAAQQLYRWVDKDGKVHYTQTPPPAGAAKSVERKAAAAPAPEDAQLPYATRTAMRNFPVTLFVSGDCGAPCKDAEQYLGKRGVPFRTVSISDAKGAEELKALTGAYNVPVIRIGSQHRVGFEAGQWKADLDLAGYPETAPRVPPARTAQAAAKADKAASKAAPPPAIAVKLYTNSQCGSPCTDAKQFLGVRGLKFEEVAVETPESFQELKKLTGGATVPVLLLGENVLIGYNPGRWNTAIDAAGFPAAQANGQKP